MVTALLAVALAVSVDYRPQRINPSGWISSGDYP